MLDIERDYVEGVIRDGQRMFESLADLAARFKCSPNVLKRHSQRGHWQKRREEFEAKIATVRAESTVALVAQHGANVDVGVVVIAQKVFAQVERHLATKRRIPVNVLAAITRTARDAHVMARLALRLPIDDGTRPPVDDGDAPVDLSHFSVDELRQFQTLIRRARGLPVEDAVIKLPRGNGTLQ